MEKRKQIHEKKSKENRKVRPNSKIANPMPTWLSYQIDVNLVGQKS